MISRVLVVAAGLAGAAVGLAGCGHSSVSLTAPTTGTSVGPARPGTQSNEQKTRAYAEHLLSLVQLPSGATETNKPPAALAGPASEPAATSLVDVDKVWTLSMTEAQAQAWFASHAPAGLTMKAQSAGGSSGGAVTSGYAYAAADSAAWTEAELEVEVAGDGHGGSVVRADAIAVWLDPTPYRDDATGPRLRVTPATGCPASDKGDVGVTNPGPPLDTSVLPAGTPTGGIECEYPESVGPGGAAKPPKTAKLSSAEAATIARAVSQLPLAHADGERYSCPAMTGGPIVVALTYPGGRVVDLWTGKGAGPCSSTSNGYISVEGAPTIG